MEVVYLLVPISIIVIVVAVAIFNWAIKSGQYDDLEGSAHSILFDDDEAHIQDQKLDTTSTPASDKKKQA